MVRYPQSPYDEYQTRCPLLGHLVSFTYCREPGAELPCRKILDCWHERFDIAAYLSEVLTTEEMEAVTAPAKPKVMQLLELIQNARGRKDGR
jgi:hypothetical protein